MKDAGFMFKIESIYAEKSQRNPGNNLESDTYG
jgi:hypothetical protein